MGFMDGKHTVPEHPQLWWRRFRDFRLAEARELYIFDNPNLCFGAQPLWHWTSYQPLPFRAPRQQQAYGRLYL